MTTNNAQLSKITTRHGLVLLGLLIAFFLIMRGLNLAHVFELRGLNFIFVFLVLRSAIIRYQKALGKAQYDDFIRYFKAAMRTAAIGILSFGAFMAIYLDKLDPAFMDQVQQYESARGFVSPVIAAFVIMLEGMASAIICAFITIQIRKSKTYEKPGKEA